MNFKPTLTNADVTTLVEKFMDADKKDKYLSKMIEILDAQSNDGDALITDGLKIRKPKQAPWFGKNKFSDNFNVVHWKKMIKMGTSKD